MSQMLCSCSLTGGGLTSTVHDLPELQQPPILVSAGSGTCLLRSDLEAAEGYFDPVRAVKKQVYKLRFCETEQPLQNFVYMLPVLHLSWIFTTVVATCASATHQRMLSGIDGESHVDIGVLLLRRAINCALSISSCCA